MVNSDGLRCCCWRRCGSVCVNAIQELVVWRTLGAGKSLLRATLWAEFALLGLVSGLVAAIGAEVALAMLQTKSL